VSWRRVAQLVASIGSAIVLSGTFTPMAAARTPSPGKQPQRRQGSSPAAATFSIGQPQGDQIGQSGCGNNVDGEPAIHVSKTNLVVLGSERGLPAGSDVWRRPAGAGGASASACGLTYTGQPNAVGGIGASGGDIDLAIAPVAGSSGNASIYVASLNVGSVSVARSTDNGATWTSTPVQAGLPLDDREWIAASGPDTALLSFHEIATSNIEILRSDTGGALFTQIAEAIPATDYKAQNNELGNLVIDHENTAGTVAGLTGTPGFWAYQSFVAPADDPSVSGDFAYNEAFVAVSNDGGFTWTDRPIPCSASNTDLDHNFPNVSVDPSGRIWYAWSDDTNIHTAVSADHGTTWSCSTAISTNTQHAIFPWLVATSAGVDLVYYGAPTSATGTWYVYFAQNLTSGATGWSTPQEVVAVHAGAVCEGGISCSDGRQLLDDFGIDTDQSGWAHVAYSHDAPDLGGSGTYTGYAVQTGGTPVGRPN